MPPLVRGLEVPAVAKILTTQTAATGTNWVKIGNANAAGASEINCEQVSVYNTSGTTLSFGYGTTTGTAPTGETFELPDGASFGFRGLSNVQQLYVQRSDQSGTQVTFKSIAEGA